MAAMTALPGHKVGRTDCRYQISTGGLAEVIGWLTVLQNG
jgi:hypothetical protein